MFLHIKRIYVLTTGNTCGGKRHRLAYVLVAYGGSRNVNGLATVNTNRLARCDGILIGRQEKEFSATTESSAKNVGNTQNLPAEPAEVIQQLKNVGKRKTPADLLELIPSASPIRQTELFEAARQSGINQKYARQFLNSLIADKGVLVQKIPREKAKSALGYVRANRMSPRARA